MSVAPPYDCGPASANVPFPCLTRLPLPLIVLAKTLLRPVLPTVRVTGWPLVLVVRVMPPVPAPISARDSRRRGAGGEGHGAAGQQV